MCVVHLREKNANGIAIKILENKIMISLPLFTITSGLLQKHHQTNFLLQYTWRIFGESNLFYAVFLGMLCTADACMYEGWNFNSGNYLFTTDTK